MTTLKERTAEVHAIAESQPFIKTIFAGNVDKDKYRNYVFQLAHLYGMLETLGDVHGIFDDMLDLKRMPAALKDYEELAGDVIQNDKLNLSTANYLKYLNRPEVLTNYKKILAHIYVRHMGDLFGGQMLAKVLPGSNHMYKFPNIPALIKAVRAKISDDLADEAIIAFNYNIEMIKDYND
jgi:heme oxygenase